MSESIRIEDMDSNLICKKGREYMGATQSEMGALVGRDKSSIWRYENTKTAPPDTLIAICEISIRLKQDGDGLEQELLDHMRSVPEEKRSGYSALLSVWNFCRKHRKFYIVKEICGANRDIDDFNDEEGERGPQSMQSGIQVLKDFKKSIVDKICDVPPEIRQIYEEAFLAYSNSIEKLELAQEFEKRHKSKEKNQEEQED